MGSCAAGHGFYGDCCASLTTLDFVMSPTGMESACAVASGFYEGRRAPLTTLDFVMSPTGVESACAVASGFYEGRCASLTTLDFVMSPTGKGPLNDGPLHPRVPGALPALLSSSVRLAFHARLTAEVLGTPSRPAPHSYAGQLPCGASAPRAICPPECACAQNSRCPYLTWVPLPSGLLRRMCRRQGPTSHASTHSTLPLSNIRACATVSRTGMSGEP